MTDFGVLRQNRACLAKIKKTEKSNDLVVYGPVYTDECAMEHLWPIYAYNHAIGSRMGSIHGNPEKNTIEMRPNHLKPRACAAFGRSNIHEDGV